MAYKVIILYQLYMPSYFLGTFTEYPSSRERVSDFFLYQIDVAVGSRTGYQLGYKTG